MLVFSSAVWRVLLFYSFLSAKDTVERLTGAILVVLFFSVCGASSGFAVFSSDSTGVLLTALDGGSAHFGFKGTCLSGTSDSVYLY